MKLRLLLIYICVVFCHMAFASQKPAYYSQDIQRIGLYGKIKSYRSNSKLLTFDKQGRILQESYNDQDSSIHYFIWQYDDNKIERSAYNVNGDLNHRFSWLYENGQRTEYIKQNANLDIVEHETWEYVAGKKSKHHYHSPHGHIIRTITFDTSGQILTNTKFTPTGNIYYQETWKRNEQNQLLEATTIDHKNNYSYKIIWTYNSDGQKTQYERFYKSNLIYKELYKYDKNGNLIENMECDAAGNIVNRIVYLFNNQGKIIEEQTLDSCNTMICQSLYSYDEKGRQTEFYSRNLKADYSYSWKFDKNGHKIEDITYYNGVISKKETWNYANDHLIARSKFEPRKNTNHQESWKYDKKGNRAEYTLSTNNRELKECWKYNKNNQIIHYIKYDSEGFVLTRTIYKYDKQQNCIKQIEYHRNKPKSIYSQNIEYYK